MTRMAGSYSEISVYWRSIKSTLNQRGLLRQRRQDGSVSIPQARYLVAPDFVAFVLDMHRLAGVSREQWLDHDLWAQLRATLQGRRVFCADSAGLAVVVARDPGEKRARLPARLPLNDDLLAEGDYTAVLGVSAAGPVVLDLAEGERALLVGGSTGTGKTGTVRALVLQLARKCAPDRLALAVIDLKALDFTALARLPHLVRPVATEESDAEALVAWCVGELERRQAVMSAASVTRWDRLPEGERFPLLLLVVDEVADFADSPVMGDLVKIARKGRASGISLILATQRPDAQVLSRQVKANVTTRLAFRVTDAIESRIILDRTGAEQIKRVGLALCNAGGRWRKVQCAFVPDDSIGEWIDVAPAGPVLSEVERALVAYAVRELGGAFTIGKLYEAHKGRISQRRLTALAQKWEARNWLTTPRHATDARKVTPELLALCPTLDVQNGDRVIGVIGGDRDARAVTGAVIGNELPPFLRDREVMSMQRTA